MVKLNTELFDLMGIPRMYRSAYYGGLKDWQKKIVGPYFDKFEEYVKRGVGLYIHGENGVGKSYIGVALAIRSYYVSNIPSFFISIDELKECWIQDHPVFEGCLDTVLERVSRVHFLVIDDIGKEYKTASGFAENKLGSLIRKRVRDNKATILTTNLLPKEFSDEYDKSVYGLVSESSIFIDLKGPDLRKIAQKKLRKGFNQNEDK